MTVNINDLTLGQIKYLRELLDMGKTVESKRLPMPIGRHVFIRTVTHYYLGRVTACAEEEVELDNASWVADTGRFYQTLADWSKVDEIDPYPGKVVVNRGAIVDWSDGPEVLPREAK